MYNTIIGKYLNFVYPYRCHYEFLNLETHDAITVKSQTTTMKQTIAPLNAYVYIFASNRKLTVVQI